LRKLNVQTSKLNGDLKQKIAPFFYFLDTLLPCRLMSALFAAGRAVGNQTGKKPKLYS